jgi:hypothetical protein
MKGLIREFDSKDSFIGMPRGINHGKQLVQLSEL